ncbi:MAG: RDD family protein, partial [Acidobacteriota bacterium]
YFFQMIIQVFWMIACFGLIAGWKAFGSNAGRSFNSTWAIIVYVVGVFAIDTAYFAGFEIATDGKTPGKKLVHLRVITREGGTPGSGALLTRNLLRVVDILVGVPLLAIDPLSRRLGDRLAGTLVAHDRGNRDELVLRRIPDGWQAADVALVESLLRRGADMEKARAEPLAQLVMARIQREQPGFIDDPFASDGSLAILRRAFRVDAR